MGFGLWIALVDIELPSVLGFTFSDFMHKNIIKFVISSTGLGIKHLLLILIYFLNAALWGYIAGSTAISNLLKPFDGWKFYAIVLASIVLTSVELRV